MSGMEHETFWNTANTNDQIAQERLIRWETGAEKSCAPIIRFHKFSFMIWQRKYSPLRLEKQASRGSAFDESVQRGYQETCSS